MGKATQDLRNEHDAILFVLQILDKMLQSKEQSKETMLQYYGELVYFLQIFADKCHHGKEELYLFQEMVRQGIASEGGPIGVMLEEHARGREYIAHMSHALSVKDLTAFHDAAVKYRDLLRQHIDKENGRLSTQALKKTFNIKEAESRPDDITFLLMNRCEAIEGHKYNE